MSSLAVSTAGTRRGTRLLAAIGAAALGIGALVGIAPAAQADDSMPPAAMSGTITFKSGFKPNYGDATNGPFGPMVFGYLIAFDKAAGAPNLSSSSGPAFVGLGLPLDNYDVRTRTVGFNVYDIGYGSNPMITATGKYALAYFTPDELKTLESSGGDPSKFTINYVTNDGVRTTSFAKSGTFKLNQKNIKIDLDPKVAGKKPTISGTAKVGKKLKAKVSWQQSGVKSSYQWYRNGKAIKKATKSTYKVSKADRGKKISVKVTGKKSGYKTLTLKSSSKKVKKTK